MIRPVIAIDGPAASGKGTLARRIAETLGVAYLETGLLYRAVSRRLLDGPADTEAAAARIAATLTPADLGRPDLRTPAIDRIVSRVAAWPTVRAALLDRQRLIAQSGAVLDGRDIGTVVCPDAHAKLFVTASSEERARRRLLQRGEIPTERTLATERAALEARDAADSARSAAPFVQAPDAVLLDTTALDIEQSFDQSLALIRQQLTARGSAPRARQGRALGTQSSRRASTGSDPGGSVAEPAHPPAPPEDPPPPSPARSWPMSAKTTPDPSICRPDERKP